MRKDLEREVRVGPEFREKVRKTKAFCLDRKVKENPGMKKAREVLFYRKVKKGRKELSVRKVVKAVDPVDFSVPAVKETWTRGASVPAVKMVVPLELLVLEAITLVEKMTSVPGVMTSDLEATILLEKMTSVQVGMTLVPGVMTSDQEVMTLVEVTI